MSQMQIKLAELRRRQVFADKPREVEELHRMIQALEAALAANEED